MSEYAIDRQSKLVEAGGSIGRQLLEDFKLSIGEEWEKLSDADKHLAVEVGTDLGVLLALQAVGQPVAAEIAHARAALANLSYVRAKAVERAFWSAAGRVVATLAKGLLAAL